MSEDLQPTNKKQPMSEERRKELDAWYNHWHAAIPESKLELIDGKLVIGTLTGSRRILWEILNDYGPSFVLSMAATELWWQALQQAYLPQTEPKNLYEWQTWADQLDYAPEVALAGPHGEGQHDQIYQILMWGLRHVVDCAAMGAESGPDFVMCLGEDGFTPDLMFIDQARMANLYNRYVDGPPAIAIEIVTESSQAQDCVLKLRRYEQAGIPEYWLIEPKDFKVTFHRLQANGCYAPQVFDVEHLKHFMRTTEDIVYRSAVAPDLAISIPMLFAMKEHDRKSPWLPFQRVERRSDRTAWRERKDGIEWDTIPFVPRSGLKPVAIRFEEFVAWCGRAKFERYGGGIKIDGTGGTERVAGMLLMTFGLIETVKLLHPRQWIMFLESQSHQAAVQQSSQRFLAQATYTQEGIHEDRPFYWGKIAQLPNVYGDGETLEACQQDLQVRVEDWVLLRLARREPIPDLP